MKNRKWILSAVLIVLLFLSGCGNSRTIEWKIQDTPKAAKAGLGDGLEVHFIDVGQGDATLIRQGEHAMLIDAGDNSKGTAVQSYLMSQKIEKLDYVIGTHPDSDHIGGLDVVLYKFEWDTVMMPEQKKATRTYEDVLKVIQHKNCQITVPKAGDIYELGMAEFTIVCPQKTDYGQDSNNGSIGLRLTYGDTHFLFTGDAEKAAEQDMLESGMELSADVFKAAHHGSDTANTEEFLEAVNPKAVVISCGEGNSYGHPRAEVMNRLWQMSVEVYRTDEQGTIVAYSDGRNITWNMGKSESRKAGEPIGSYIPKEESKDSGLEESQGEKETYVLNENTGKFHKSSCSSVEQMSEQNRKYVDQTREELEEEGYEPCKRCNP